MVVLNSCLLNEGMMDLNFKGKVGLNQETGREGTLARGNSMYKGPVQLGSRLHLRD